MKAEGGLQITRMDPWFKQSSRNPAKGSVSFVGRYDLGIEMVLTYTEALFLSGGPDGWRLWAVHDEQESRIQAIIDQVAAQGTLCLKGVLAGGLAVAGTLQSGPKEAARELFKALVGSRLHYTMPAAPFGGGLLSAEELGQEVADILAELERNDRAAEAAERANPSPIVLVAMTFELNPRPAGHNPTSWVANCPGGHHWIMISTSSNQFGCGYCRRKGGPGELLTFCEDHVRKVRKP